tara:strand:+ start:262 stop:714 length:453 start_codon:yes stop_codon:yes gene_type:complete
MQRVRRLHLLLAAAATTTTATATAACIGLDWSVLPVASTGSMRHLRHFWHRPDAQVPRIRRLLQWVWGFHILPADAAATSAASGVATVTTITSISVTTTSAAATTSISTTPLSTAAIAAAAAAIAAATAAATMAPSPDAWALLLRAESAL